MIRHRQVTAHRSGAPLRTWLGLGLVLVLATMVVAACGSDSSSSSTPLEGTTWTLTSATDLGVDLGDVAVTAMFENNKISGNGGCNQYNGTAKVDGSSMTIGDDIASTMMACEGSKSEVEAAYLKLLPTVASFEVKGKTLTLKNDKDASILIYEAN